MSRRWLGLLLLGICIGHVRVAHAVVTANPTTVNLESPLGPATQFATGTTTISSDLAVVVNFTLTGTGCGAFLIETDATDVAIGPGDDEIVRVRFTPGSTPGLRTCALEGNDGQAPPGADVTVQLRGTGFDFTVSPLTLTFGSVDVGAQSNTQRVTATNHGTSALTISSATFTTNASHYIVAGNQGSQIVPPVATTQWDIACRPNAQNDVNGNFRIVSNAQVNATQNLSLTCSGNLGLVVTSPTSHNFAAVVEGNTDQQTIALRNDGNVPITGLTGVLSDATRGYVFNAASVPTTLAAGQSVNLSVNFAPQDGQDGGPATITFSGSWGNPAKTATAVLMLDGDGRGVDFSATPTLRFSDFRFDMRPELIYQITNAGDIDVRIEPTSFMPDPGTVASELLFTIRRGTTVVALPQTLSPGDVLAVTVRAQPNNRVGPIGGKVIVHSSTPATDDREVVISGTARTAALTTDPPTMMVDFDRVDIDGGAQTQTIILTNTGNAALDIQSITPMNVNSAFTIGTITPAPPTTLAVNASLTISVTYDPALEKAPGNLDQGVLVVGLGGVIGVTQAMIPIQGRGIDRHVTIDPVTPPRPAFVADEDGSFVNVTVRNTGEAPLQVMNMMVTPAEEWAFVNAEPFVVEGVSTVNVTVRFTPTGGGERTGELVLTTDDGEVKVPLSGTAVLAQARIHGGGGCAASRGAGSGAAIAVAGLLVRRHRRRRTLATPRLRGRCRGLVVAIGALITLIALGGARRALADDVVVGVFDPTPSTSGAGFQLDTPEVGADGSWVARSVMSYATDLLVIDWRSEDGATTERAIRHRMMLGLGGSYAFLGRFEAGVRLPMYSQRGDAGSTSPTLRIAPSGTALGDLTIHGKARLARTETATFGAALHLTLPTATDGQFTGVDAPSLRVLGLASWAPGARLSLSATIGGVLRKTSVHGDTASISQGSGLVWGTGASYRVLERLWATGEVFGELVRSGRTELGMNTLSLAPMEALAGVTYRIDRAFSLGFAAGRGLTSGVGAPGLRGVVMLSYTAGADELPPLHPYVRPEPERDVDGDGLVDERDRCPREAEDGDSFEDSDGCPDLDNDRDRIADASDKCPLEAEDLDGFQDADGCAEKDNDGDGIVDAQDKCRDEAEDRDGFQDADGCAEKDNDGDGIVDAIDRCPAQAETRNGKDDHDGCPDRDVERTALEVAEETWKKGRELMQQGKYAEACAAFEQSQQLDPQFGTQYNLAGCYEKSGKLATAWNLYRDLARSDNKPARRKMSGDLAKALADRVPRIKLVLVNKPEGTRVFMNNVNASALIGIETPVDLGTYSIVAGADGHRAWRKTFEVKEEGKVITVTIELERQP